MADKKNIFVIGLDDFNRRQLASVANADRYAFHGLLEHDDVVGRWYYPIPQILRKADSRLRSFSGSVDAIISHFDFPASTMLPVLRRNLGHRTPSLESVLKCEHKYWSRLVQGEVVPEHTPRYSVFDPFDEAALMKVGLRYPFWMKPVKSFSSYLGFKIDSSQEFRDAIHQTREQIWRFRDPFNYFLDAANIPDDIAAAGGGFCIAEEIISADHQATVEGYVQDGEVVCYAIIDSVRRPGESSFMSYEYPSTLPEPVKEEMVRTTEKLMRHIGYDHNTFNIEFFWDESSGELSVLEVNPRISESHCPLFELVAGASHHEVAIDVALGNRPRFPRNDGPYSYAGKYFVRRRRDGRDGMVERVPHEDDLRRIAEEIPDTRVRVIAREDEPLSALMDQDSYSFELAVVFVGGHTREELREHYRRVEEMLPFEIEPIEDGGDRARDPGEQPAAP